MQLSTRSSVWISIAMCISSILLSVPLYVGSRLEPYLNFSSNIQKSGKETVAQMSDILVCRDTRAPASR